MVLIVDDDRDIRETLGEIIADAGHGIHLAANGAEALSALQSGVRPGAIVLDLMMPIMDGWEFLRRRNDVPHAADVPVVVISASGAKLPTGAAAFLPKPLDVDRLLELLRAYSER